MVACCDYNGRDRTAGPRKRQMAQENWVTHRAACQQGAGRHNCCMSACPGSMLGRVAWYSLWHFCSLLVRFVDPGVEPVNGAYALRVGLAVGLAHFFGGP